ncbi:MAG: methyl-accepting chemotaxis protein [Lachnospiraceae bacterium]|nr:methyl-accepting chemotaxis protein [Lachnospiraceae bacterium]
MKLKQKLLMLVIIPLVIIGLGVAFISSYLARNAMVQSTRGQLAVACEGYSGDVNAFKEQDIDITVFVGDTRAVSSIDGVIGTKASDEVIKQTLQNKQIYFSDNANVNGQPYYGYYIPTEGGMLFAGKPQAEVQANINSLMTTIMVFALVAVVIAGIIAFFISGNIAKLIINVSRTVHSVADGDLTCEVEDVKGRDEVIAMNNSVKTMIGNLRDVLSKTLDVSQDVLNSSEDLRDTSTSTLHACEEIAKAIEDVAQNNTSQAGIASDITAGIGVMQEKTSDIVTSVSNIEGCAASLIENCNDMRVKITATQQNSSMMSESVISIKDKIDETNKVIAKMSEILAGIEDIASQTKLLSLNASIEAARAGEFGKGFSVVADNIRTLSENTGSELVSIKEIISNIVSDFKECADSIDIAVKNNEESSKSITEVISSFEAVDSAIQDTTHQVDLISAAVGETNQQLSSLSGDIMTLGEVSESNAAASQQVNASVEELTALMGTVDDNTSTLAHEADTLKEALAIFKL